MRAIVYFVAATVVGLTACSREHAAPGGVEPGQMTVSGVVKDATGAPIRGALVTVADGPRSIARFADASGAYRIAGAPRKAVRVTASGYGFAPMSKTLAAGRAETVDFKLAAQFNPQELTTSEILTTLPQNDETRWLQVRCISCHGLTQPNHLRGVAEPTWIETFKSMQEVYAREEIKPEDYAYVAKTVAKYFGPNAPEPTASSVRRAPLSDEALKATFYEIDLPTPKGRLLPHSIVADNQGGAWVALSSSVANAIAHWDLASGKVEPIALNVPKAAPHTPTIDHKGRVWTGLLMAKQLTVLDPKTRKIDYLPLQSIPHTLSTDSDGFIWGNGEKVFRVNPETREIKYWTPAEAQGDKDSWGQLFPAPGRPHPSKRPLDPYHAVRDSKGFVWFTSYNTGLLTRLDPRTAEQTVYKPPGTPSSRGLDVDANDVVWFSNWGGHALMKFDPATGKFTRYKFPTEFAMPYSVFADRKRGKIWVSDFAGNHLTRFDPRTERFVEYPLPHNESYPRFLSIDDKGRIWFAEWWNSRLGMMDPGS